MIWRVCGKQSTDDEQRDAVQTSILYRMLNTIYNVLYTMYDAVQMSTQYIVSSTIHDRRYTILHCKHCFQDVHTLKSRSIRNMHEVRMSNKERDAMIRFTYTKYHAVGQSHVGEKD